MILRSTSRLARLVATVALFLFLGLLSQARAQDGRVIILGFDGGDGRTVGQMMEQGELPNLSRLAQEGSFAPLGTTTAAESPVAWAALNTGQNPAKTGVPGFVKRKMGAGGPQPAIGHQGSGALEVESSNLPGILGVLSSLDPPLLAGAAGVGAFILFFIVFAGLLRLRAGVSAVLGIALAGIGAYGAYEATAYVPGSVPRVVTNPVSDDSLAMWEVAGAAGKRCVVLDAAMSWDREEVPNVKVLSGLGVPDSRGSNGDWFIYTTDEFEFYRAPKGRGGLTAGTVFRVDEVEGKIESEVFGPTNFWAIESLESQFQELEDRLADPSLGWKESSELRNQQDDIEKEMLKLQDERVSLPLVIEKTGNGSAKVAIGGQEQTLAEGEWSDYYRLTFELNPLLKAHAITRVKILSMDDPHFELFVNSLDIDPENPPFWQPVSQPMDYSAQLAKDIGKPFETFGWACITMAYKDEEIDPVTMLEDIEFTMGWREELTYNELAKDNWDLLFSVFSTTDRVQHMTYHFYDPSHPLHDPEMASRKFTFFGKEITLAEAIPEIYRQADRIVGKVMDEYLKPGDTLMLCADHGFQSFRRQVHVNNWLENNGFLKLKPGVSKDQKGSLRFVDWSQTQAYALGLGMIYLNLEGREPNGIVSPDDADSVLAQLKDKWLETVDPETGENIVSRVYIMKDVAKGPHLDQQADMMPGFAAGYRVSWSTTLGDIVLEEQQDGSYAAGSPFENNLKTWSGGHVSVDPELVRGIFFCNRKVEIPEDGGVHLMHVAPTALDVLGVEVPANYDRAPLSFR